MMLISLASTDVYGNPYDVPSIYDILSEKEMAHHKVDFMNAKQLYDGNIQNYKASNSGVDHKPFVGDGDNLRFVYETQVRKTSGEISDNQRSTIYYNHGIDQSNAIEYYNSQRLKGSPDQNNLNVYDLLLDHIRRNPDYDYFIDELPILINRKCKLQLHFIQKCGFYPIY